MQQGVYFIYKKFSGHKGKHKQQCMYKGQ